MILSPGANPIHLNSINGINRDNVFTVRNVADIKRIKDYITSNNINDIAVVGGGFIGVEITENLRFWGKNVTLIEALNQIMNTLTLIWPKYFIYFL